MPEFRNLEAYRLDPDANVQITFSMGSSSAYMAWHIAEANGGISPNWKVLTENTGFEREAAYDFWSDFQQHTGIKITMLERRPFGGVEVVGHNSLSRDGGPFRQLFSEQIKRRDGTVGPRPLASDGPRRLCSGELKTKTAHRYLRSLGWRRYSTAIGFRADEPHRVARRKKYDAKQGPGIVEGGIGIFPLFDAGVTKIDVLKFWNGQAWDLDEMFGGLDHRQGDLWLTTPRAGLDGDAIPWRLKVPSWLSNCKHCFMAAEPTMKARMALDPDSVEPWIEMEGIDRGINLLTGKPRNQFFRPGRKSMAELREEVLAGNMTVDAAALKRRPECGSCHD